MNHVELGELLDRLHADYDRDMTATVSHEYDGRRIDLWKSLSESVFIRVQRSHLNMFGRFTPDLLHAYWNVPIRPNEIVFSPKTHKLRLGTDKPFYMWVGNDYELSPTSPVTANLLSRTPVAFGSMSKATLTLLSAAAHLCRHPLILFGDEPLFTDEGDRLCVITDSTSACLIGA